LSDILLKNKRYKDSLSISKETIRQLIAMYSHNKGFQNHEDYKKDINDFIDYANTTLGFNTQYSEEQIQKLNSIVKKHPWITSPMSRHLADTVKQIFEKQNINFSIIPLTNNKYVVNIPDIQVDEGLIHSGGTILYNRDIKKVRNKLKSVLYDKYKDLKLQNLLASCRDNLNRLSNLNIHEFYTS
jgi:hypothetical protein